MTKPSIQTRTLACGMPLIVENIPGVRSVGLTWLLPAGSATDPAPLEGLSPMWSELVFRGCGDLNSRQQADALDRLGLSRSSDVGTFHLRLSFTMLGDRLLESLGLITDMVRRPRFEAEAIEPTRDLCLQQIESLADDPYERAVLKARELHNGEPFNRSGMGTEEGLGRITRDDLVSRWAAQVRPEPSPSSGAVLAIAGAVDGLGVGGAGGFDAIAARLDDLLRGWSGATPAVIGGEPTRRGTMEHVPDDSSQVQVVLLHEAPPEGSPDSTLERFVTSALSGGMSSRLFTEVREKRGLCYSVSSGYATERNYGRVLAYVGTTPERAQTSLDVLWSELERIKGGIEPLEFDRALIGLKSSLVFSGESTSSRATALATDYHRIGRPRPLAELAEAFDKVRIEDVNAYLRRREMGPVTIVTLGPAALKRPSGA